MAGFGGSPGLAILAGVADGISKREERKRKLQADAVVDRLRNAQIEQANQEIAIAAARESRAAGESARQATEHARKASEDQANFDAIVKEHIKKGETRAEAQRHARVQIETKKSPEEHEDDERLRKERLNSEKALGNQRTASAGASSASARASNARAEKTRHDMNNPTSTVRPGEKEQNEIEAEGRVQQSILDRMVATGGTKFDEDERKDLASKAILMEYRKLAQEVAASPGVKPEQLRKAQALVSAAERAEAQNRVRR